MSEISQREYFEAQLKAQCRQFEQQLASLKELVESRFNQLQLAIDTAAHALDIRLHASNDARGALEDQARTWVPRLELDQRAEAFDKRITRLESTDHYQSGRRAAHAALATAALALLTAIIAGAIALLGRV